MSRNGQAAGSSEPVLRSGLYIVRSFVSTSEEQAYVVYWPEDTTWDDHAASSVQRNRVTFMRYSQPPRRLLLIINRIYLDTSANYAINWFVCCRVNIQGQLRGITTTTKQTRRAMTTATAHQPTQRKVTQTDFIISRWRKQRIRERMLLSERGSWYAVIMTMLFSLQ